jgi:hypothetical protein
MRRRPVAASGREGKVQPDRSGEPLEPHRSEGLEADPVGLGGGDDLIGDQDLTCFGCPAIRAARFTVRPK